MGKTSRDRLLAQIAGRVKYYQTGIGVPGVTLMLSGDDAQTVTSAADGSYGFTISLGSNYVVTPTLPNDPAPNQGVTTLDIVLIRRHILGTSLSFSALTGDQLNQDFCSFAWQESSFRCTP